MKKLLHYYTFVPSENKITVEGIYRAERFLLITNVTRGITIFTFNSANSGLQALTHDHDDVTTTITLDYNCGTMSSTDKLQIFIQGDEGHFEPSETFVDPVSKFRVSNPENLIDTDFEYGPQASKWETLQLINQIPSFFSSNSDTTISFIEKVESTSGSEIITVTTSFDHGISSGVPITVTGLKSITAEGTYLVQSVPTTTTFTYKARSRQLDTQELQGTYTSIIPGEFFQGSQIKVNEAFGITSDFFTRVITVKATLDITVSAAVSDQWELNQIVTSDGGATGVLSKVSGNVISLISVDGTFSPTETLSIAGSSLTYTISSVAGSTNNKFFVDGNQQDTINLVRNSIEIFDVSDSSLSAHPFALSTTDDGTHNGGSEYTTFVYKKGTIGTAGAYIRLYVTNSTPSLYYYCGTHSGMGGSAPVSSSLQSKVLLRTDSEHGFADNTNFYFVNSIAPKALDILDTSLTAPDGQPIVDTTTQITFTPSPVQSETIPYNYESTYTLRFSESNINYTNNTITLSNHGLESGYALLYYPAPGDTPITGLSRMCVYYAEKVDADTIKLHDSQRTNLLKSLSAGGTFNFGKHNLGLCYNVAREYKVWGNFNLFYYTYYWSDQGTYSGHDFVADTDYGLGGQAWDIVATFSIQRPGFSGHNFFLNNTQWNDRFRTNWQTYGYDLTILPLGTTAVYQGGYDFITDDANYGANGNNDGNYQYGYTLGGYNRVNARTYWQGQFSGEYMEANFLRIYGTDSYYWAYQGNNNGWWASRGGFTRTNDRSFGPVYSDGNTNMYFMLCKENISTNDSFYAVDHNLQTNYPLTLTVNSGNGIRYWSDLLNATSTLNNGASVFAERVDQNRFRIKTSTSGSIYRIAAADGSYTFTSTVTNPFKNSIYIADNQFSNNELILVTIDPSATAIGGLTNNQTYYFKAINENRFQLGTAEDFTTEITLTSTGSGLHTFENASANFGAVDGSYTTTEAIDEFTLEITLPFKIAPGRKPFDARENPVGAATTGPNGYITIQDHYFSTGTRIIYDAAGNTPLGGIDDNRDYYAIVLDDQRIRLAASLEDANSGTATTITAASTGTHRLITANLSGLISGAGTISVTNGARTVIGTNTSFKRYFKIGDTIRLIDTSVTPGVIYEKTITAIKDDNELLVDSEITFTNATAKYFIPTFIYVRPDGYFLHRPFDGGMEIGTSKSPDGLICRQTRKYFRYQSGKGIQTSFAINFTPQNPIVSLAYTPQGVSGTYNITGNLGDSIVTVSQGTANLHAYMEIDGTGIDLGCTILRVVDSTRIELSLELTQNLSNSAVTLTEAQLSTIRAQRPHNVLEGTTVTITGSAVDDYNGDFSVAEILNDFEFTIRVQDLPENISSSGGFPQFGVKNWLNSSIRAGMFDFQNGFFFEYDGQYLNCVRRSSVQQLTGTVSVTRNSNIVTGDDTQFSSQLSPKDNIVIRGMTHRVVKVRNNTEIVIQPAYKGVTNSSVIMTKTVDVRTPQHLWNIDICDGTGPTGFNLEIDRIQMAYMDYSWYGAGKIRYGFKDQNGHVKYVHEYKHNNKLTESYFRSGNLPARYEIENIGTPTFVPSLFHWGTSVIMDGTFQDDEAYLFTATGNVLKFTNSQNQTATTTGNSSIVEQRVTFFQSRYYIIIPFAAADESKLEVNTLLYGTGYFVDGRAIDSRSYTSSTTRFVYILYKEGSTEIFPRGYGGTVSSNVGTINTGTTFSVGAPSGEDNLVPSYVPLLSIRLAPSVDSSITGALGDREIINRMQLDLESVGVQVTHDTEISLVLNAELSTDLYQNVPTPSLCQLVRHNPNETISGGQRILSFRASGGSVEGSRRLSAATDFSLAEISSLGNSILGGDGVYPNGPDLLTIIAEVVDSTGISVDAPYSASARITWKESQA
jgi:hypothetical protein